MHLLHENHVARHAKRRTHTHTPEPLISGAAQYGANADACKLDRLEKVRDSLASQKPGWQGCIASGMFG